MKAVPALLPIDAETPRSMVLDPPLTDAEFDALCAASDWFRFERNREGEILILPPAGGFSSIANAEITGSSAPGLRPTGGEGCSVPALASISLTLRF